MTSTLLPTTASAHEPHVLHTTERIWTETNCYVDLWIEVLHSLGLDPLTIGAFAVSTDFEGDQWTFFKPPPEDLWTAFGIDVHEMNVWKPVLDHVVEQLDLDRLVTVEVDARYLPDTAGVSYGTASVKTTIVPNLVDPGSRALGYFHNAGYFELHGDDFDGLFGVVDGLPTLPTLPPYVEVVRLEHLVHPGEDELTRCALQLLGRHLARRPSDNPVWRMDERINADAEWVREQEMDTFHLWAFATVRQCGASAEMAGAFCQWLARRSVDDGALARAAEHWRSLAEGAKSLEFLMARLARGRSVDIEPVVSGMASDWSRAQALTGQVAAW
jgi:hypothetical protein